LSPDPRATLPPTRNPLQTITSGNRRAVLIYVAAIVAPVCVLVWLGLQSFERQRQAVEALTTDKIEADVTAKAHAAASAAFADRTHPIARYLFVINRGLVVEPMLRAPLPRVVPAEFANAERQELALKRPDLALERYRALAARHQSESLALQFMARCLSAMGRVEEARSTWRTLASTFPDDRDLAGRPYGIVAAINAGETAGLFDQVSSGRWDLAGDQAEYFLSTLDPSRPTPYLDRFRFARDLEDHFRPPASLREGEIYAFSIGDHRTFYRADGPERIAGFEADPVWMNALHARVSHDLNAAGTGRQAVLFYGGATALVLLVLSAGILVLFRDVSREARLNQLQSHFVSGVTHELKTPITIMRLYSETLLRQRDLGEAEQRDFYRVIGRESARLGRLVDRVLTFSRIERGDVQYEMQDGDLAPVIAGVVDDYGDWLEHLGFTVERAIPASSPPVRFDPAAVSQAVINLLDNAVKYSGTSRTIAVRLATGSDRLTLEVEDHGLGIASADRARIFDRFYRAANGSGKGGYGLGLFMVRHIMDSHGGRAEVESEPGRGSRFRLTFPVVRA
jgi:signal transduction histidine kinase